MLEAWRRLLPGAPVVRGTLALWVVVYVAFGVALRASPAAAYVHDALLLDPAAVFAEGRVWQLVSYGLLHDLADAHHLVFNGVALYFFGPELERRWGSPRFAGLLVGGVVGGALVVWLAHALGLGHALVVGGSAGALAATFAWCVVYSRREVLFFLLKLTGKQLAWLLLALEALEAVSLSRGSAAAHLGGMAVGTALAMAWEPTAVRRWVLERRLARLEARRDELRRSNRRGASGLRVIEGGKRDDGEGGGPRTLN